MYQGGMPMWRHFAHRDRACKLIEATRTEHRTWGILAPTLLIFLLILSLGLASDNAAAQGGPSTQDSPVTQCAEGVQLFQSNQWREALPKLELGFTNRYDAEFPDYNDLGLCAVALGVLRNETGDQNGAIQALEIGMEVFESTDNLLYEAVSRKLLGQIYMIQGRYDEAQVMFEEELSIWVSLSYAPGQVDTLNRLGATYYERGQYTRAQDKYEEAITIARALVDRTNEGVALNGLALVHVAQGLYDIAHQEFLAALAIRVDLKDPVGEGLTLGSLGLLFHTEGRYRDALEFYGKALVIARRVGDRIGECRMLSNIGGVYRDTGRYGESLEKYKQALRICSELNYRAGIGAVHLGMGEVYKDQGRFNEASMSLYAALDELEDMGAMMGQSATLSQIGTIYGIQGKYDEAMANLEQGLTIARTIDYRIGEGAILSSMGLIMEYQGLYREALVRLEAALAVQRSVGDRNGEGVTLHNIGTITGYLKQYSQAQKTLEEALVVQREIDDRVGEAATQRNIGFLLEQQGRLNDAISSYEDAMDVIESVRASAGDEEGRISFFDQHVDLYSHVVALYHQLGRDDLAFSTSERGRARAFLDTISTGYVEWADDEATELLSQEQETYSTLKAAKAALERAKMQGSDQEELISALDQQVKDMEAAHSRVVEAIDARQDKLAALIPRRSSVLGLADIQELLDDNTTLVSYQMMDDKGTIAFVITRDSFRVVDLPDATREKVATDKGEFYSWYTPQGDPSEFIPPENAHPLPLSELHTWLVEPLYDHLQTRQVVIVPHQLLHSIPFAALGDGKTYFGERYSLSILPSANALHLIQQNAAAPHGKGVVVFGSPSSDVPGLGPLVHCASEAKASAELLGDTFFLGEDASEARLKAMAQGAKVVHLCAHGKYEVEAPLLSAISLAPGVGEDGQLQVHEVYGLELKGNELVVLSACETSLGKLSAGDEVVGLARAFFFAGAPTVLASLWVVDDMASEALMVSFYSHWLKGMSKADALRAAQIDVRNNPRWASPFFWAGFVLNGDPGQSGQSLSLPDNSRHAATDGDGKPDNQVTFTWTVIGGVILAVMLSTMLIVNSYRHRSS
jgi:CHAT domain-containing protein